MTVTVIRHRNPNEDADSVSNSYAKAVKDAIASATTGNIQISSAWDAASGSIVTTILDFT